MPNWCSNTVILRGSQQSEVQRLANAFMEARFCDEVIPTPECLTRDGASTHGGPNADEYDRIRAENKAETGFESWYDFCTNRWGTKWDVGGADCGITLDDDGLGFTASFESAWAPPTGVYQQLVEDGFQVLAYYYEPGMCFAGRFEDGIDDCYSDWGDAQGARDMLPDDLDEHFGISESQAEWEEEQRMDEELYRFTKEGAEKKGLIAG